MRIDLDYIKKWMKISDEELMERLVKDAVGLQEEAREREHQAIVKESMQDKILQYRIHAEISLQLQLSTSIFSTKRF